VAQHTLWLLNSSAATYFWGNLQVDGSAPGPAAGYGWVVNTVAPTKYCQLKMNNHRPSADFGGSSGLAASSGPVFNTGASWGDSYRSTTTISDTLASGAWQFTLGVMSQTGGTQQGHFQVRLWASVNADGSSPRELTSGPVAGSTCAALSSSFTSISANVSWSAPTITLTNEYLFIQFEWVIDNAGGGAGDDVGFYISNCSITTPLFVAPPFVPDFQFWQSVPSPPAPKPFYGSANYEVLSSSLALTPTLTQTNFEFWQSVPVCASEGPQLKGKASGVLAGYPSVPPFVANLEFWQSAPARASEGPQLKGQAGYALTALQPFVPNLKFWQSAPLPIADLSSSGQVSYALGHPVASVLPFIPNLQIWQSVLPLVPTLSYGGQVGYEMLSSIFGIHDPYAVVLDDVQLYKAGLSDALTYEATLSDQS